MKNLKKSDAIIIAGVLILAGFANVRNAQAGDQTAITPAIQSLADNFIMDGKSDADKVANAAVWMSGYFSDPAARMCGDNQCCIEVRDCRGKVAMNRTAQEILHKINYRECSDHALAFVTLVRAKGIAANYVQTVDKSWLDAAVSSGGDAFDGTKGHAFAEVLLDGKWRIVDPQRLTGHAESMGSASVRDWLGNYSQEPYISGDNCIVEEDGANSYRTMLIMKKGLDVWEFGWHSLADFKDAIQEKYFIRQESRECDSNSKSKFIRKKPKWPPK